MDGARETDAGILYNKIHQVPTGEHKKEERETMEKAENRPENRCSSDLLFTSTFCSECPHSVLKGPLNKICLYRGLLPPR